MRNVMLVSAVLLLGACSREPSQAAPTQAFEQEGVSFALEPQSADDCAARGASYKGTLRWQVPAAEKIDLEIRLRTADGQVFLGTNQASGSEQTGDWVEPGIWFLLLDRSKDETIAAIQAGPSPCQ